jgi:gliding motility-associated-like protein
VNPLLAQCDPSVPTFTVDLSNDPNGVFNSPLVARVGNCCGTTNPDKCVSFVITLHPLAEGIIFDICDGAVPTGSMFYQVGCGPQTAVGTALCLNGPGPHLLTFCKPGNNPNVYCITSVADPGVGPDQSINDGCSATMYAFGYDSTTVQWTSIFPGAPGQYDGYMDCSTCMQVNVDWQSGAPAFIDYEVCGYPLGGCSPDPECNTVRIYFNPTLSADIVPPFPVVCFGSPGTTITAVGGGGSPPYSYLWSTGDTTPSIFVGPGTYSVLIADTTGCPPISTSIVVGQFQLPIQANGGGDLTVCGQTGQVLLNGSVQGASGGQWTGQGTFQMAPDSLQVLYTPTTAELNAGVSVLTLTTTGNGGCPPDSDVITITWSSLALSALLIDSPITCTGSSTGSIAFTPADPALTYLWDDPSAQTTPTAVGLGAGLYTVNVTDSLGCDTTLSLFLPDPAPLVIDSIVSSNVLCNGQSNGTANAYASGGTPGYSFMWDANAGNQTGNFATGLSAGNYTVDVTDQNGCAAQGAVQVAQPPPITLTMDQPDPICVNTPITINAYAAGGNGSHIYTWQSGATGSSVTQTLTSQTIFTVSVTDSIGCPGPTAQAIVEVIDLFSETLTAYGDTVLCDGGNVVIGAQFTGYPSQVTMNWPSLGAIGPGPFNLTVNTSTLYPVVVTDICNNQLFDTVSVLVDQLPDIVLPPSLAVGCAPLEVQFPSFQSGSPLDYQWYFGDGSGSTSDAPIHTYGPGNYSVQLIVTGPNGCVATSAQPSSVTAYAGPTAGFSAAPWITDIDNPFIQFTDQSIGMIQTLHWDFHDGTTSSQSDPSYTYQQVGIFPVALTVTDVNGCQDSIIQNVQIQPVYDLVIPNAFTPDDNDNSGGYFDPNDLSNNVFYPFVDYVDEFRFLIFNRWGELVFESVDPKQGWDGRYKGRPSPSDVYSYRLQVTFVDGVEMERYGDVTLFR